MNKTFIKIVLFSAIVAAAGWNISQSKKGAKLSDIALENVEALTSGEGGGTVLQCWQTVSTEGKDEYLTHVTYCSGCIAVLARSWNHTDGCKVK